MSLFIWEFCLFFSHVLSNALISDFFSRCEIWSSHGTDRGEFCLLGFNNV